MDLVHGIDEFAAAAKPGLIVLPATSIPDRATILQLAALHQLPTIGPTRPFAVAGGLMSYGSGRGFVDLYRRAPFFVDRILRGTVVSDLPVEYPTKFQLVINLKTAKAIGLEIPTLLLGSADEVIE